MDYEKAYKNALERAKDFIEKQNPPAFDKGLIGTIFPELKESEDERVRKALIEMVHDTTGDELWIDYNVHKEDALAWLEKQGHVNHDTIETIKRNIIELFDTLLLDKCFSIEGLKNDILKTLNDEKIGEQKPTLSKEDERISKEILYFLSRNTFQFGEDIDKYKSWMDWLEKQANTDGRELTIKK